MTSTTATFTVIQRASIEALRCDLTERTQQAVTAEYGMDEGQHWAALCVETLPKGAWASPGPLVSIVLGAGASGHVGLMSADGAAVSGGLSCDDALKSARLIGIREYQAMRVGAYR